VGVKKISFDTSRGAHEAGEEGRHARRQPWPPTDIADDPVPIRQSEPSELGRADDFDLNASRTHVLHRNRDESSHDVFGMPWVGRGQYCDPH
jgi:hypothetical protein